MLWLKAAHIFFVITWFSGIFYLPRLFVYHAMSKDDISIARFKIMERKLYYGIMWPSSILATVFGLWLLSYNFSGYLSASWMIGKLILVALLWWYQLYLGKLRRQFSRDANSHSHIFYRWLNELPVLLLAGIIIFIVVRPTLF